ncbi:MAG: hypothetical protein ACI85K_002972, partial [Hyphomicrobiaceae bacterium]
MSWTARGDGVAAAAVTHACNHLVALSTEHGVSFASHRQ